MNCLHSFRIKSKLESHKKVCDYKNVSSCNVIMPSEDTKILEFNQNQKADIIYADLEIKIL